jgi:hypothetical protein
MIADRRGVTDAEAARHRRSPGTLLDLPEPATGERFTTAFGGRRSLARLAEAEL